MPKDPSVMNADFAQKIVDGAMAVVNGKNTGSQRGFGSETFYAIDIPYAGGSEEQAYFSAMLNGGTMKDPNYIDLFERVCRGMEGALQSAGGRTFVTLNCRFNAQLEDNFLLYIFIS